MIQAILSFILCEVPQNITSGKRDNTTWSWLSGVGLSEQEIPGYFTHLVGGLLFVLRIDSRNTAEYS